MKNTAFALAELVAPLTEAEFSSLLRERQLTVVCGTNGARYRTLLAGKPALA